MCLQEEVIPHLAKQIKGLVLLFFIVFVSFSMMIKQSLRDFSLVLPLLLLYLHAENDLLWEMMSKAIW